MTRRALRLAVPCGIALVAGCSYRAPAPVHAALGGGDVARVGQTPISGALVAAVAAAMSTSRTQACAALVDDALLAEEGRSSGLGRIAPASWVETTATAARLLDVLGSDAEAAGPPTAVERTVRRVIHAVVLRSTRIDEERALAIASSIELAERGVADDAAFELRARTVPQAEARVVVERLGPFAIDGRLPDGSALDPAFVAAAFALSAARETSPVIETTFGWHVLMLVDSQPLRAGTPTTTLDAIADAVHRIRVVQATQRLLRARRARERVSVSPGADAVVARALAEEP